MVCGAEVVPVVTELKVSEAGATAATGAIPVPLKATVLGDPVASWTILTVAVFAPNVIGLSATLMVQVSAGATAVQPFFMMTKSAGLAPISVTPLTLRLALPMLVSVMACVAEVAPVFTGAKASGPDTVASETVPIPLTGTVFVDAAVIAVMGDADRARLRAD